jgi:hypothetical protein
MPLYTFLYNLLNVLVHIANKMGIKKILINQMVFIFWTPYTHIHAGNKLREGTTHLCSGRVVLSLTPAVHYGQRRDGPCFYKRLPGALRIVPDAYSASLLNLDTAGRIRNGYWLIQEMRRDQGYSLCTTIWCSQRMVLRIPRTFQCLAHLTNPKGGLHLA